MHSLCSNFICAWSNRCHPSSCCNHRGNDHVLEMFPPRLWEDSCFYYSNCKFHPLSQTTSENVLSIFSLLLYFLVPGFTCNLVSAHHTLAFLRHGFKEAEHGSSWNNPAWHGQSSSLLLKRLTTKPETCSEQQCDKHRGIEVLLRTPFHQLLLPPLNLLCHFLLGPSTWHVQTYHSVQFRAPKFDHLP